MVNFPAYAANHSLERATVSQPAFLSSRGMKAHQGKYETDRVIQWVDEELAPVPVILDTSGGLGPQLVV